jgi:hypothetical protein
MRKDGAAELERQSKKRDKSPVDNKGYRREISAATNTRSFLSVNPPKEEATPSPSCPDLFRATTR